MATVSATVIRTVSTLRCRTLASVRYTDVIAHAMHAATSGGRILAASA